MRKTLFNHLSQYTFLSHSEIFLIIWKSIMVTKHQVKIDTWLVYDLYDLGCPNTFRDFLLWGHFQLTPLPHCPSDKTFVPDNITI